MPETATFEGHVILELLGHRRLGGYLTETTIAGASFLRIDIPAIDGHEAMTQFVAPSSVYAITPTTEEIAHATARLARPAPVSRWELAAIGAPQISANEDLDEFSHDPEGPF